MAKKPYMVQMKISIAVLARSEAEAINWASAHRQDYDDEDIEASVHLISNKREAPRNWTSDTLIYHDGNYDITLGEAMKTRQCPKCGKTAYAETVDVGPGEIQCEPYQCDCGWVEPSVADIIHEETIKDILEKIDDQPLTPSEIRELANAVCKDKEMRVMVQKVNHLLLRQTIEGPAPARLHKSDLGKTEEIRQLVIAAFVFKGWRVEKIELSLGGFVGYDFYFAVKEDP